MNSKRFKKVYIEITNACNLHCSFCSVSNRPTGFMPLSLFAEVIDKIYTYTSHIYLHVKGEPLFHPHLSDMLDLCHEKKLRVIIVTNGTLLSDRGEMLLTKPALRQVNISLHCFSELQLYKNKNDYLKAVIEFTKKALSQSPVIISLRFWNQEKGGKGINPGNPVIFREIEKEFAPGMVLEDILKPGKGLKLADRLYLNSDFEFSWPSLREEDEANTNGFCYGLRDQLAILYNGTVVPCCLDAEGVINLGNIHETSFEHIFTSHRAQKIYDGFSNGTAVEPLCQQCRFKEKFG
jgi:radical SAM protein with 4Fe4S-binding SPASM domain